MSGHAYSRPASQSAHYQDHTDLSNWELVPDVRAGPLPRRRRRGRGWVVIAVLALAGGAWATVDDKRGALEWLSSSVASAVELAKGMTGEAAPDVVPEEAPPLQLAALGLLEPGLIQAALPDQSPQREIEVQKIAAIEPETNAPREEPSPESEAAAAAPDKPAPLPPLPPLTDPLQKKAEAAGLHPELSRALLQSLTANDFKNAASGITKAIAETPEDGVLLWPPKPGRGLARFRIHFVPGISPACRRYVVGVAKSGWLTTALPMERCGVKPKVARSAQKASQPRSNHP